MKLKYFFILFILGISTMVANAQVDRLVYWIHGLGGDASSWQQAAEASMYGGSGLSARRLYSYQPEYTQFNNTISTASTKLHQDVLVGGDVFSNTYNITDKTQNFIIAHSQGGIVSRYLDKRYNDQPWLGRRFGGIVTFGTPHQGAQALNNQAMLTQLINEGCNDLLIGPATEQILRSFPLKLIVSGNDVENVLEPLCKFVSNTIVPILTASFTSPIQQDYRVGAAALSEINGASTPTHKVAFYGVEEEPVMYRMLYNLEAKKPNQFPTFEADDDSPLVDEANNNLLKYQAKLTLAQTYLDAFGAPGRSYCSWYQWLSVPLWCAYNDYKVNETRDLRDIRNGWRKGVDWWTNANSRYEAAIGAADVISTTQTGYECFCTQYDYDGNEVNSFATEVTSPQECYNTGNMLTGCSLGNTTTVTTYQAITKPSDGLVLEESASDFQGAPKKEMVKSNHQQMRNDSNTKDRLTELYDGRYGSYFFTAPR